jgi:hypothetical protein
MWLLLLFLLGAAPAWAEDLGEVSANLLVPLVHLVCLVSLVCLVHLVGSPIRPTKQTE